MNKFDERVSKLVDVKTREILELFKDGPDGFADLEAGFKPVFEKLNAMHNLMADIKQEVRRLEKTASEKPKEQDTPKQKVPDDVDVMNLTLEDLRQYITPGTEVGPYDPSEGVWEALRRALRRRFQNFRIPGLSPDYLEELLKGFRDVAPSALTPDEIWYIINNPDLVDPLTWKEVLYWMFFPSEVGKLSSEKLDDLKSKIQESRSASATDSSTISTKITETTDNIIHDIGGLADQADDLAQTILTELLTCCATLNQKMDVINRKIDEGGGQMTKQDTLLVRKKMSELDTILEELRRELRQLSEVRDSAEKWFEERRRDSLQT